MRDTLNAALKDAMKAQDKRRMGTLRLINAAIKDRDIEARTAGRSEGIRDDEILELLQKMVKQRQESAKIYEEAGRTELAQQENEELAIIRSFMPEAMNEAESRAAIEATLKEIGAEGLKDMGRAMAALKERYAGRMDFSRASALVRQLLA